MQQKMTLGWEEAERVIATVFEAAKKAGCFQAVAVVDNHGDIICSARMDGASPRSQRSSLRKAYTAAVMGMDTPGVKKWWQERGFAHGDWNGPQLTTMPGGLAVVYDGQVVGALGVAGGNAVLQEVDSAALALQALGEGFDHRPGSS